MPNTVDALLNSMIARASKVDPAFVDIFTEINNELKRISKKVDLAPKVVKKVAKIATYPPANITVFTYNLTTTNVILTWEAPNDNILLYEIRKGSTWETATFILKTATLQAVFDPLAIGTHTYLIKVIDSNGIYSFTAKSVSIIIPTISSVIITTSVIGNNVLLYWTIPTSTFRISYYEVKRGSTILGNVDGTFKALIELTGGTFNYTVTPYDIIGNAGAPSTILGVIVSTPSDFVLKSTFTSAYTGTKTNAVIDGGFLLVCVNLTETYQDHFDTRTWTSPQSQVDAGYLRYIQPVPTTASYLEQFDTGVIYTNTIIGISYSTATIEGAFTIGFSTRVSNDGISWSSPQTGQNIYVTSVRYIEVTITFTGGTDKALLNFFNFQVSVNVKQELDSGEINAISTDVNGTTVTFNKSFKDVDSITVSTKTTTEQFTAVYRFNDIPNPTNFTVFVYDTSGIRVNKTVEWKARGIV